ncbi:hypothetical protein BU23DRAFT_289277 [Bimuria novae-zelandiae CBS 107.79]|uniref:WIBG Mago-binding domain-containing protein n=1 Tax=Bimuria novae-zelandiae CBS 107.79 TaxID=1447943 RepID=A0A6A5UU69_9PLEO|nr:hypothetical protein BU23DRAFT_289277 [Bimuria novae-zelandiae CBS 107.79]
MPTVETTNVSRSGITTSETGERHVPSSTRADGSVRKEIKVRPGYRPPEDVEIYKNRTAEGFRQRGKAGIPGAEGPKEESEPAKGSPAANKNAKRREARKKAAAAAVDDKSPEEPKAAEPKEPVAPTPTADPAAEKEKEAKKLMKKLRQARELKDKKEKGDVLLPEQLEKVIKINELIRQLEGLGFDANGERKNG